MTVTRLHASKVTSWLGTPSVRRGIASHERSQLLAMRSRKPAGDAARIWLGIDMIFDSRRYISVFAVFALVMLRLVVGWHFFREGTQKIVYDQHDGDLRMNFSAEGFLKNAKGPLADMYTDNIPNGHDWRELLAAPRQNKRATEEELA